jgi:hypothetical protein
MQILEVAPKEIDGQTMGLTEFSLRSCSHFKGTDNLKIVYGKGVQTIAHTMHPAGWMLHVTFMLIICSRIGLEFDYLGKSEVILETL